MIFALSGRIEKKNVSELQMLRDTETAGTVIALDLEELRLVDRDAIKFLARCQARKINLKNCPSYIREWLETGSDKP